MHSRPGIVTALAHRAARCRLLQSRLILGNPPGLEYHIVMGTTSYVLMAVGLAMIVIYFIVKKTQKN